MVDERDSFPLSKMVDEEGFFFPLPVKMVDERDVFCFTLSQKW
jgi:hypothetical protein